MPESGSLAFFVVNLLMLQLRFLLLSRMPHLRAFFCRECREYSLFGVEFYTEFWQKFSEILRILAEILTKKMAAGASGLGFGTGLKMSLQRQNVGTFLGPFGDFWLLFS